MTEERPLTDAARALLAGPDEQRRKAFAPHSLLVSYPESAAILDALQDTMDQPASSRPVNLLITGASGNGKSAILKTFAERWPRRDGNEDAIEVPVVRVDAPSNKKLTTLYLKLLEELHAPHLRRPRPVLGTLQEMARAARQPQVAAQGVLRLLKQCGVRLLIVDEIHSLLKVDKEYSRETLNWIKSIPNETGIPVALSGEPQAVKLALDRQLANRFDVCELPEWGRDRRTVQLLADLEVALPLRKASSLRDKEIASFLMSKSDGTIGSFVGLIEKAGKRAVGTSEQITLEGLRRAAADGIRKRLADIDVSGKKRAA